MDWLTFISEVIQALAWPLTVVVIVFILRDELSRLMHNIKRFRHKDTEIDFEQSLREISAEIALDNNDEARSPEQPDDLAILSPRGSIIESWLRIEGALIDYNQRHKITARDNIDKSDRTEILQILDRDILSKSSIHALDKLRRLRNEAVHMTDSGISTSAANKYRQMANRLVAEIKNA